jgi:hypothetical protein
MKRIDTCDRCGNEFAYDDHYEDKEYFRDDRDYGQFIIKNGMITAVQYGILCPECIKIPEPRIIEK